MGAEQSTTAEADTFGGGAHASSSSSRVLAPPPPAQNAVDAHVDSLTTTSAQAEGLPQDVGGPSPRVGAGGVLGNDLIVVGGHAAGDELADVWSLSCNTLTWKKLEPAGRPPRPRGGHTAVAVDELGVVVFGGLSHDKGYLGDVALLGGATAADLAWTPVCATGELPQARDKHSAVVDAASRTMLVFGGFGVKPPDDEDDDDDDDDDDDGDDDDDDDGYVDYDGYDDS